jgi:hypothetical protein
MSEEAPWGSGERIARVKFDAEIVGPIEVKWTPPPPPKPKPPKPKPPIFGPRGMKILIVVTLAIITVAMIIVILTDPSNRGYV